MTSLLFHNNHSVLRLDDGGNVSQRALFEDEVFLMYVYVPPRVSLIFCDLLTIQSQHTALRLLLLVVYYCTFPNTTTTIVPLVLLYLLQPLKSHHLWKI